MTATTKVYLTDEVRVARVRLRLTQRDVGELCGVSPQLISLWEQGVRGLSLDAARKVCRVLGLHAGERWTSGPRPGAARDGR